jgi:hypothetical protein
MHGEPPRRLDSQRVQIAGLYGHPDAWVRWSAETKPLGLLAGIAVIYHQGPPRLVQSSVGLST